MESGLCECFQGFLKGPCKHKAAVGKKYKVKNFHVSVQVILDIKTANLWEGARSYKWKHIESETWIREKFEDTDIFRQRKIFKQ